MNYISKESLQAIDYNDINGMLRKKSSVRPCKMAQGMGTQNFFFCWGPGGIQCIIENVLHFLFFLYLFELPPNL